MNERDIQGIKESLGAIIGAVKEISQAISEPDKPMKRRFRVPVEIRTTRIESGYRWCWAESIDEAEERLRHGNHDEKIVHNEVDYESEETTLDRSKIEEVADTDGPKAWA